MTSLKAHFDGHVMVLDEPATLNAGETRRQTIYEGAFAHVKVARLPNI